jgi:hypothetical protein
MAKSAKNRRIFGTDSRRAAVDCVPLVRIVTL